MASDDKSLLPYNLEQNPSPAPVSGQAFETNKQALVDAIMATFLRVVPSNYVALVNGPWYTLQFQAMAEQLADMQIIAEEVNKDSDFDFTRSEFLWEVLGTLVFPDATERGGAPTVDGDTEYRAFLQKMVLLLLAGSTPASVEEGAGLLTDAQVELIEKFLHSVQRDPTGAWTIDNQFEMELNIEAGGGTRFPDDPFTLLENIDLILAALKPAHTLFEARFLFREVWTDAVSDEDGQGDAAVWWILSTYHYDDLRKYCYGIKHISGVGGETLTDRTLFTDPSLSFASVALPAVLLVESGVNAGSYAVVDVRAFPYGDDATPRAYTTAPTGLAGSATVSGDVVTDTSQDWALAVEGEILTFAAGPNAGSYRLDTLLGPGGGPLASFLSTGPATQVRVSPSLLRVDRRMPQAATGQTYTVTVDRLGVREPRSVAGEDVSSQFYL